MSYAVVAAAEDGEFWDEPDWAPAVRTGNQIRAPRAEELIPLPEGARIQLLPGRTALGYWHGGNECGFEGEAEVLEGRLAVAAQLPSGFTRTLVPAFEHTSDPRYLPFFGFTAVVAGADELLCAAVRTDSNPHWEPHQYGGDDLQPAIRSLQKELKGNRILGQLEVCATRYGCYNAQNIFFGRWEGAVAVSPSCNAQCRGCISFQPEEFPPSPQERFHLIPSADEVVQLGVHHLRGPEFIYSFGQGCEGEPLLQGDLIAESIARIRAENDQGSIHLNTNASRPDMVQKIVDAGLDSIRVSLNSVIADRYHSYYQPKRYRYEDLLESIRIARGAGVYVSLNLLTMPGWNDAQEEVEATVSLVNELGVNMIQTRTLNIDPDLYARHVPPPEGPVLGVPAMLRSWRAECPNLKVGNHSPAVRRGQVPAD